MNILYLVPYAPNLIRVRPYNLIRALVRRGHQVSVATLWTGEEEREDSLELAQQVHHLESVRLPRWRSYWNCLGAIPTQIPLQAVYCWQPELFQRVDRLLTEGQDADRYDLVHVEHLRGARYGLKIRELYPRLPVVWDSVDCISLLFEQAAGRSKRRISRWMTSFELGRNRKYEGQLVGRFHHTLVTSPLDRLALTRLANSNGHQPRISVLPNGVDLGYFQPDASILRDPDALVISGKMSYHANVTMVLNFVRDILPRIREQRPSVQLWIVGKDPTPEIQALSSQPGITVTGTVDDIRPYLQKAAVAVSPVTYGVGIQNKVLEAMACGTPVVATPQAISALNIKPGREALVGDTPEEFATHVLNLLSDTTRQREIGLAGLNYVRRHHDWSVIAEKLEGIYDEVTYFGK